MKHSPFLDQVSKVIRTYQLSYRTEKNYVNWVNRFIVFHNRRHPREMGGKEIADYLTHLAVNRKVSASTQNQALHTILFLPGRSRAFMLDPPLPSTTTIYPGGTPFPHTSLKKLTNID